MRVNKISILFMGFVFLFSTMLAPQVEANAHYQEGIDMVSSSIGMNEDVLSKKLDELIISLEEMEAQGMDLVDLENNTHEQIESLSYDAKKLYVNYEAQYKDMDPEEILKNILPIESVLSGEASGISPMSSSSYYVSNQVVEQINKISGLSGGITGVTIALIKLNLGLGPTPLTLLIIAIATTGVATINMCNWNNRGFDIHTQYISHPLIMPMANVYCVPR